jgi:hypothetical protein
LREETRHEIQSIGHSRPVPYSARAGVRNQTEQMMEDGILELSDTPFINSVMIVYQENKEPRTCIDAWTVNSVMLPDWARAPPINEMLQQLHGVKYVGWNFNFGNTMLDWIQVLLE